MKDNIDDYSTEEFLPPDDDQIEWLVGLATQLKRWSVEERFTFDERNVLNLCSRQIIRLLSMSMAGFNLYAEWREAASRLESEVLAALDSQDTEQKSLNISHFPTLSFIKLELLAEEVD